jgi:dipeptidyl-peptidase-4
MNSLCTAALRSKLVVLVLLLLNASSAIAQKTWSMEWINSPEATHIAEVSKYTWLHDGTAILYDQRKPEAERTFERFDPATGSRRPMLDAAKALASLKAAGADVKGVPWPEGFDSKGERAVFELKDKIFLLDLASSTATQIGDSAQEGKSPQFSPNDQMVAFVRANDLYVYDIATKSEKRITQDGSATTLNGTLSWVYWEEVFGRRDIGYWWSPDSVSIAYLQTDESQVSDTTFVDFAPVNERIVHQRYPKPGQVNPKVRVGVTEVANPNTRWVNVSDQPYEWILRVKWLPDSSRFALETLNRPQTDLRLYFVDRKTTESKHILTETDPAWVNVSDDLSFTSDDHFLWSSERDGFMHLYRYKMDGTLQNKVTNGDWAMVSSGGLVFWVRQSVAGIDEKNDWIYFTALKDSSVQRNLYRVKSDGSGLSRISAEPGAHRITMSPDARFYFDQYSNISTLPSLQLHSAEGKQVAVIDAPRPELFPADVQYAKLTTIPAGDGFAMPAQILKPRNFDPKKKYPVILHTYGGPSAPTVINQWQAVTLFDNVMANDGYIMIAIDNRAATGISKKLENTLLPYPGESEASDLVAGVQWLKKQPWVDPNRVGVYGWSGGGTVTLNLMIRSKEFKAGISGAPVTDWHYYDSKWGEALLKLPQDNAAAYDRTSMVKHAADLSGHLMIVFGTGDDNVHPQNELAFMNALIEAGKPFEVKIYPMRKHGFLDAPAKTDRDNTFREFWRKWL